MDNLLKSITCLVMLSIIGGGAYKYTEKPVYQEIRVAYPITGKGYDGAPLVLDTTSAGGLMTKSDFELGFEPLDQHFFKSNLTANTNHTHDANDFRTTINELGGWDMYLGDGVIAGSLIELDSGLLHFETTGTGSDINLISRDDIFMSAGLSAFSYLNLYHNKIEMGCDNGNIEIDGLVSDNAASQCVTRDAVSGMITVSDFGSGTYEVSISDAVNAESTPTATTAQVLRVANIATVSGSFTIDPDLDGTEVSFLATLPFASSIEDAFVVAGTGTTTANNVDKTGVMQIRGDVDNDKARISIYPNGETSSLVWYYSYTYRIIN